MSINEELSLEEKVDYIYNRMRKQQKLEIVGSILKWGTRLFVVASLLYFFFVKLPVLKDEIIESITPEIPKFDVDTISNSDVLNSLKEKFSDFSIDDFKSDTKDTDGINNISY